LRRARGERPYDLGGTCRRCAQCCEAPAIQVGRAMLALRSLHGPFLWWQRVVNGFELVEARPARAPVRVPLHALRPTTRACDSYGSRPGMCRDYPRALLWQPRPEMLPGCGYKPVNPRAVSLARALDAQPLTDEQRAKLAKGLFLDG
jgi:hypothetical protein